MLVALIAGFSKGTWSAIGNLGVLLLSLAVDPLMAAKLLFAVSLISDGFGLWAYRHSFDRRRLAFMIPAGLIGVELRGRSFHGSTQTFQAEKGSSPAYLMAPAVLAVQVGKRTGGMVSEVTFSKVITWALLIVGLELLGKAPMGLDPFLDLLQSVTGGLRGPRP